MQNMLEKWLYIYFQLHVIFKSSIHTLSKSHMYIFITSVKSLKNVNEKVRKELITQSKYMYTIPSMYNMLKKGLSSTTYKIFEKCPGTSKSNMHIFNVSITTVKGLKNVSLKVWEELTTQSRYIHHKTSRKNYY
jgi:hypothetical protein